MTRFLTLLIVFFGAVQLRAEPSLSQVRFGFPAENGSFIRNGNWIPIQIEINPNDSIIEPGKYLIELESSDGEGASYLIKMPVEANKNQMTGYLRPGSSTSPLIVRLKNSNEKTIQAWPLASRSSANLISPRDLLIATLGLSAEPIKVAANNLSKSETGKQAIAERIPRKFSEFKSLYDLPESSLGLSSLDMLILSTHSELTQELLKENHQAQRKALAGWVLSGGKLLLDSGKNWETSKQLLELLGANNCKINGLESNPTGLRALNGLNRWVTPLVAQLLPLRVNELAKLVPSQSAQTIIREPSEPSDPVIRPILVQIPFGRGQIFLFALSLSEGPFSKWEGQQSFWDKLLVEISPRNPGFAPGKFPVDTSTPKPEVSSEIQRSLESFPEIPAFPFGWVAILILAYIVLVGPVDYLITHYWLKKPELTWLTFSFFVLVASWAAWAGASSLKGNIARVNKLDLLDFDLFTNTVQCKSWMSFFSPAPGNYAFALQPEPTWLSGTAISPPELCIMEVPDRTFRGGSRTVFQRPYEYNNFPQSLDQVGIPAWACASLDANLQMKANPQNTPFSSELAHSRIEMVLVLGTITNNLPVDLEECSLFYQESWYNLGSLQSKEKRRIDMLQLGGRGQSIQQWYDPKILAPANWRSLQIYKQKEEGTLPIHILAKAFCFHSHPEASDQLFNSFLRKSDLSWRFKPVAETFISETIRVRHAEEIILVGRIDGSKTKTAPSDIKISIKKNGTITPINPLIHQETFVRVILPVQAAKP